MIIQCDNCKTRFKLAEDKLKPGGVKVRCTSCKEIFTVSAPPAATAATAAGTEAQPAPPPAPPSPPAGNELDFSAFDTDDAVAPQVPSPASDELPASSPGEKTLDFGAFEMEEDESGAISEETFADFEEKSSEDLFEDFDMNGLESDLETQAAPQDQEFTDLEVDESASDEIGDDIFFDEEENIGGDLGETFEMDEDHDEPLPGLDEDAFSMDEDSIEFDAEGAAAPATASATDADAFDFATGEDDESSPFGTESAGMEGGDEFAFDETDFDTGIGVEATPGKTEVAIERPREPEREPDHFQEEESYSKPFTERPAPAKPSKKKSSKGVLVLLVLLLTVGGAFGFLGWHFQTYDVMELVTKVREHFQGGPKVNPNSELVIGDLSSYFVDNKTAGQLFIIQGSITNKHAHPRSAISVKGTVYDETGKSLLQQVVYCGNRFDRNTLASMPFSKIEEGMNNQFGELLSNLNLKTGKTVPFTIVFKNLPKKVAEYSVIIADSRPGSAD